jgi:hypothetical protein
MRRNVGLPRGAKFWRRAGDFNGLGAKNCPCERLPFVTPGFGREAGLHSRMARAIARQTNGREVAVKAMFEAK